ncbi:MAG: triose-phosphate isomerase [Gammaproteobacteria bacterium]
MTIVKNKKTNIKRKPLIAGNWKMCGSRAQTTQLLQALIQQQQTLAAVELAVFPPFVFLEQTQRLLHNTTIAWGAQNVSAAAEGAYTGEISAGMLLDFGCRYVLVGHSERRTLYGENDEIVAAKFQCATQAGLTPIVCVGETLAEHKAGHTTKVVKHQIDVVLKLQPKRETWTTAIVAYEPVWAIGTGMTATPEQAQAVHALLRQHIAQGNAEVAQSLRILYGGSVKPENAAALFAMPDIDGGLIGKASLDSQQFLEIARACNNLY